MEIISIYGIITLITYFSFWSYSNSKSEYQGKIAVSLIDQFKNLENLGKPKMDSPFRIASSSNEFTDSPIQLSIFSDFQCPACKALANMMHPIARKYKGKINIQYYYYPLDSACNSAVQRSIHPLACKAAYLATCLPDKWVQVHDEIFENQGSLSLDWVLKYAKKNDVVECTNDSKTKELVVKIIDEAKQFNVQSTPTMLLNGVKIEGALPLNQMYILMDELIKKAENNN